MRGTLHLSQFINVEVDHLQYSTVLATLTHRSLTYNKIVNGTYYNQVLPADLAQEDIRVGEITLAS